MRIAVMLRAYDRPGGIGIYARNIVRHLLQVDQTNEYYLLHSNPDHIGTYSHLDNVHEIHIPDHHPVYWDQVQVPRLLKGKNIDVVLNTKFSVPLAGNYKKLMVLHGASWHRHPELYGKFDVFYTRIALPYYCKKSDFIISNSDLTTRDYKSIFGLTDDKIETVNLAAGDEFHPVNDRQVLDSIKKRYRLPGKFLVTVTSYDPRKNFGTIADVFERCRQQVDIDLLVVGKDCDKYIADFNLDGRGLLDHICFPGWVDQADLPGIYSLAEALLFPSIYEEFGIPVVEAITAGCPVVSSSTGAIPELLGDAALLCDPFDADTLVENILSVVTDEGCRRKLIADGFEKAKLYSWEQSARKTLDILERVYRA